MSSPRPKPVYELRSAKREDAEFFWHLRQAALRPHVEKTWGKWDDAQQRKFFDRGFVPRETRVIMVDGQPGGRLDVSRSRLDFFLGLIEILPELQGRGLGSAVVRDLQEEARTKRVPIRLQVIKANEQAVRLYERLDFKRAGETKTHHLMLWQP
jgi:ribosomal protein S18 acetylase RimI-like enzyme